MTLDEVLVAQLRDARERWMPVFDALGVLLMALDVANDETAWNAVQAASSALQTAYAQFLKDV